MVLKELLKSVIGPAGRKQVRALQASARARVYGLGNDVECPICGSTYSQFLPFNRLNALCYTCKSLERHRLVYLYLKNKTDFFTGKNEFCTLLPKNACTTKFASTLSFSTKRSI